MKFLKHAFLTSLLIMCVVSCDTTENQRGFAVVIDQDSYQHTQQAVDLYMATIAEDGLQPILVVDSLGEPQYIREQLRTLYEQEEHAIEGAVFIGDIPVPMVRNAQHFTRAFKMDEERYSWDRSSVPSDRYYDDFDLEFEYIKRDSLYPSWHYMKLKPASTQYLQPEIYTGRIKPGGTNKYQKLNDYLEKLVRIKKEDNPVDQVMFFAGHGYNSESMVARMDEKVALYEHFPSLKTQRNGLQYLDHSFDEHIRTRLMSELQRKDLDMALLHHHGHTDTQYLSGMPLSKGVHQKIDAVRLYLRSKLRTAKRRGKNLTETKKGYIERLGVPETWFEDTFDAEQERKDSIYYAQMDITLADMQGYVPKARFVMFDSCFNGAFQSEENVSEAYLFGPGETVIAFANSVSSLQDKWPNEFIGLLAKGVRMGQWSKEVAYLETHLMGDPTFRFTPLPGTDRDWAKIISDQNKDHSFWLSIVKTDEPDLQAMALRMLYEQEYPELSNLLLQKFKESPYGIVRMESLKLLTTFNDQAFKEALILALDDSYEFVRRQALYLVGRSGDPILLPHLLEAAMANNTTKREEFNIKQSLGLFAKDSIEAAFESVYDSTTHYIQSDSIKKLVQQGIFNSTGRWEKTAGLLLDTVTKASTQKFNIRSLRNYNYHPHVSEYLNFIKQSNDTLNQVRMLEALGWFNLSYEKGHILELCNHLKDNSDYPEEVRLEALRTYNRLRAPWFR